VATGRGETPVCRKLNVFACVITTTTTPLYKNVERNNEFDERERERELYMLITHYDEK